MKRVLEEQDRVMTNQAQEIDERQNEIETLSTELQTWQERCSFAEKELDRKKTEIANFKQQTSAANEENKRWDTMTEEINKLKVPTKYELVEILLPSFFKATHRNPS